MCSHFVEKVARLIWLKKDSCPKFCKYRNTHTYNTYIYALHAWFCCTYSKKLSLN